MWALVIVLGAAGAWIALSCVRPASFKSTKYPRPGQAIGQRVAVVYSTHYEMNLGGAERLHPFDIHKYAKIYLKLQTDGYLRPPDVFVPQPVTKEQVLLVHSPEFMESLRDSEKVARYLEAPLVGAMPAALVDAGILNAFRWSSGGTIEAARQALRHGIGINIGGGYHHAKGDSGEGFNVYNDLAITIRVLRRERLIRRACVVDLDVHQGNGTATVFAGDNDVFTFSMHQGDIYPIPKAVSSLDIELPRGTGDEEYLRLLRGALPGVLDKARPDIVLLQAGCDTLAGDPLAGLRMSHRGIVLRDAAVIDACVARHIPVVMALGGGYSQDAWQAQYASIARTIDKYGLAGRGRPHAPRSPTAKERFYTR
ncbi:MAG TPA: histone deacetylase [Phycisphaerae bacterium]|nr:histone deacetylase [Phycisphaerae bacterium]